MTVCIMCVSVWIKLDSLETDVVVVIVKTEPVRINSCWFLLVLLQDGAGTQLGPVIIQLILYGMRPTADILIDIKA